MCQFSAEIDNFDFSGPNLPIHGFRVVYSETNVGIRISVLEIPRVPIFRQKRQLSFFRPNLPKNRFCVRDFKNLIPDSESASPRYHVCQFPVKMDNFEFFGLTLGKLPNYVGYFGSNNVERTGWRLR